MLTRARMNFVNMPPPSWVFPSPRAESGHMVNTNKAWGRTMIEVRAAIIERSLPPLPSDLVLYCARHTFATQYLDNGGNLSQLMVLLGHSSITVTQKYLHPSTAGAAEVMNKHNRKKADLFVVKSA